MHMNWPTKLHQCASQEIWECKTCKPLSTPVVANRKVTAENDEDEPTDEAVPVNDWKPYVSSC